MWKPIEDAPLDNTVVWLRCLSEGGNTYDAAGDVMDVEEGGTPFVVMAGYGKDYKDHDGWLENEFEGFSNFAIENQVTHYQEIEEPTTALVLSKWLPISNKSKLGESEKYDVIIDDERYIDILWGTDKNLTGWWLTEQDFMCDTEAASHYMPAIEAPIQP